ncbi:uncharacterized protein LOC127526871 [Erpetoichthys calabaricus]|uniref:uncharacterized protein LOC127526871 n=1 Tax=Erpetoichthys calabaricus TaxID=27687 RepID=UPI0022347EF7|nr:uncharacterized protein LOC127526871 [Erpetoichthys calabaricus]XP_051779995.1 uncharacterized protein LOC127526871 [Erpetoichthys calabaricus]XP_051779996.1 uncharacterized protein LOC127526871 [Erpetoichthys calabaricus]
MDKQVLHQKDLNSSGRKNVNSSSSTFLENDRLSTNIFTCRKQAGSCYEKNDKNSLLGRASEATDSQDPPKGTVTFPSLIQTGNKKLTVAGLPFIAQHESKSFVCRQVAPICSSKRYAPRKCVVLKEKIPSLHVEKHYYVDYIARPFKSEIQRNLTNMSDRFTSKFSGSNNKLFPLLMTQPTRKHDMGTLNAENLKHSRSLFLGHQLKRCNKKRPHGPKHAYLMTWPGNSNIELHKLLEVYGKHSKNEALILNTASTQTESTHRKCVDKSTATYSPRQSQPCSSVTNDGTDAKNISVSRRDIHNFMLFDSTKPNRVSLMQNNRLLPEFFNLSNKVSSSGQNKIIKKETKSLVKSHVTEPPTEHSIKTEKQFLTVDNIIPPISPVPSEETESSSEDEYVLTIQVPVITPTRTALVRSGHNV